MNDTSLMVIVPCDLLEQALDAAAAVGMQDVADELNRILTPPTTQNQITTAVLWRHRERKPGRVWNYTQYKEVAEKAIRLGYEVQGFADPREIERLSEENLHHRNLQIEADDLIKSLRVQLAELQASVREYLRIDGLSVNGSAARNKALTMLHTALATSSEREARHD
ncbi:hypothetical protein NJI34_05610 [Pseudomonas sp. S 311-6]|uniref:hypothetical protein n=1 Tax=Pseudomonas TaxID=286 RepID=UPI0020972748|nr:MULTISPECIES: hypothetical protein [Pseudomonas]MCO7563891.1 hypothetical protein [Pseudomonas mosselii]MCO7615303.1 hypothetical protein [Pseudomonas guariconensis]MCO7636266.1 hypothetical protein [Pseudomonas sp. S 311-6]